MTVFFFFNDTATTEIYTLSLHDALPIWSGIFGGKGARELRNRRRQRLPTPLGSTAGGGLHLGFGAGRGNLDRKSTRLNSSHLVISYAVFCLKKKIIRAYSMYTARHIRMD